MAIHGTKGKTACNMYLSYIDEITETERKLNLMYGAPHRFYPDQDNDEILSPGYHTFGVEWDEDYIRYFVDGVPYGMVEITDGKYELLKKELYLSFLIGVEMTPEKTNDECAQWPLDFCVDWVRVYQREGGTITFGTTEEK